MTQILTFDLTYDVSCCTEVTEIESRIPCVAIERRLKIGQAVSEKTRGRNIPFLRRAVPADRPTERGLKETVHLQKNVKQIIFKQILYLKCEE